MAIPPDPVLRAAARWLHRLPVSGAARCRALFTTHRDFSDITPTQYEAAYAWLHDMGLLDTAGTCIPSTVKIFDAAISDGASWFNDADTLIRSPEEIPEDAMRAAAALGIAPGDAFTRIGAVWGKVDATERARIGTAAEEALIGLLSSSTTADVEHIAAWSDAHGYDISVNLYDFAAHLEVKATTRHSRLTIYLSRNEYRMMTRDDAWCMVAVRLTADLEPAAVATVPNHWLAEQVPTDGGRFGHWESCRLDVPTDILIPGVETLTSVLNPGASDLLTGYLQW